MIAWWIVVMLILAVLFVVLGLALSSDPTIDPREFGDHLDPALTGNAGARELVELAARVRKESKGYE